MLKNTDVIQFLRYELRLLRPERAGNAQDVLARLIDSATHYFQVDMEQEEKKSLLVDLLQEFNHLQDQKKTFEPNYYPPFIIKEHPHLVVSEQHVAKARRAFELINQHLMELIDPNVLSKMNRTEFFTYLKPLIHQALKNKNVHLNALEQQVLEVILVDEMVGFGPLEPLLADPSINDILVNSPSQVYVERHGSLTKATTTFRGTEHLLHIIHQIVSQAGRRIDAARPYVNAKLEDGTRINAIIPPIVLNSPTLSIRKFSKEPIYLENMVMTDNLSPEMAMFLMIAVKSRLNILISGGTGSGKTTLLNAMSDAISEKERIITIEDIAELRLNQQHIVRLETRNASLEGGGSITERELVINALRMRPDRLILGEVRGAEAFDMLQAMNTGHEGSMSTIHANKVDDVAFRFADMLAMANVGLTIQTSLQQIKSAIHLIVHTSRLLDGKRRIMQISEITGLHDNEIHLQHLFEFKYRVDENTNSIVGNFVKHSVNPLFMGKAAQFGLDKPLQALFPVIEESDRD